MVRGGDELVDEATSTNSDKRSRPRYDGSAKAYKPWAVKAKAHFRKRAQLDLVLGATEDPKKPAELIDGWPIRHHGDGICNCEARRVSEH